MTMKLAFVTKKAVAMAGTGEAEKPEISEEAMERWRLARREDLVDVIGFSLVTPAHGEWKDGTVKWGVRNIGGNAYTEFVKSFESEVNQILNELIEYQVTEERVVNEAPRSQPYSTGPAAQEWPSLFFELASRAMPLLEDGSVLIGWGMFLKSVIAKLRTLGQEKNQEVYQLPDLDGDNYLLMQSVTVEPAFTVPALMALCYEHCVGAYGVGPKLKVAIYPRSAFAGITSAGHPTAGESFVIQLRDKKRQFFYVTQATGEVHEHFLLTGSDVTLLPIPSFGGESTENRRPEGRIEVEVPTTRRPLSESYVK